MARRGTFGRQKIPIERIEKESNRQVTFSKRRPGVFKKANELSTLTGAETAVIIFSPGGTPYSYGHPNLDSIVDRFMNGGNPAADSPPGSTAEDNFTQEIIRAHQRGNQNRLNAQLDQLMTLVENEKRRAQALKEVRKVSEGQNLNWWERPIDELDLQQLEQLKVAMEQVKSSAEDKAGAIQEPDDKDETNWPVILPPNALVNRMAPLIMEPGNDGRAAFDRVPAFDPAVRGMPYYHEVRSLNPISHMLRREQVHIPPGPSYNTNARGNDSNDDVTVFHGFGQGSYPN